MPNRRRLLFFGTWLFVAILTKTVPDGDHEISRLGTVESIVKRGTYQLDDSSFIGTRDKVFRDGHFYSHQAPLLATLEAPVFWVLQLPGLGFNNRARELVVYLFSVFTNGLALALTVLVFSGILRLAGVPRRSLEWLAFIVPMATWLLPYGITNNNHIVAAMLLTAVCYLLLSLEWRGVTSRDCLALGGALGVMTAVEILPIVSFVPITIVYLVIRGDVGAAAWKAFSAGLLVPLLAHAALNIQITGDLIPAGFHTELFVYPGTGFDQKELTGSLKHDSPAALWAYARQALFVGKGYFTFAPLPAIGLVTGVAGWRWWGRARGVQLVLLGGTAASLGAALLTTNNLGGAAVGFRHATYLAPAMLTLLLPILTGRSRAARAGVAAVAVLSACGLLLFAVKRPWTALAWPPGSIGSWDMYLPVIPMAVDAVAVAATLF